MDSIHWDDGKPFFINLSHDHALVWARRHHNDWRVAAYRLCDMKDFHLDEMAGSAPRAAWGYVDCGAIQEGDPLHPCRQNAKPHMIKVYVARADNENLFEEIVHSTEVPEDPAH